MTYLRAVAAWALAFVAVASGCTSEPDTSSSSFCGVAKSSGSKCKDPVECDTVLSDGCADLGKALTASTVNAARDCLESGVCGVSTCMSRAQKSATPSGAHKRLAQDFCEYCAPDVKDCQSRFYTRNSKLPGVVVLPYAPSIVEAVNDACIGGENCQATFRKCAGEITARATGEALDSVLAGCIAEAFQIEESGGNVPGGGGQIATCTPDNCKGCCRDDRCEDGTELSACGANAAGCQICSGQQACKDGKCKEPCGPNNCRGCCDGDTCKEGTAADACGESGAACEKCTAAGASFICSNNTCIDGSCSATCANGCCTAAGCQAGNAASACGTGGGACLDCGYGRTCTSAACLLDPNSTWDFYVSFAVVPSKTKSGNAWDVLNGAGDPYLEAYSGTAATGKHSGYTSTKTDSDVPFWQERPLKGIKASELLAHLSIQIWDEDTDLDDYQGGCTIPLTAALFDESLQSFKCPATATEGEVEVYYRINRPQ